MREHLGSVLLIVLAFYVGLQFVCILPVSYVLQNIRMNGMGKRMSVIVVERHVNNFADTSENQVFQ
jgi:hypothetical protein